jgi:ElaB/YqjD/DUF883 family membrane-anchored ribosome-binding protein
MNMADEMTQIEDDLDEARAELHQTLEQVNQKVEAIGLRLTQPENVLRLFPLFSICLAGAAGFAAGSVRNRRRMFGAFATGLLAGFIVTRRSSHDDSHHG